MIKEAIILAGGFGTRLRERLPDIPKSMAPVAGHPFLTHIIRYLQVQGIERIVFSLGYKHEYIREFLKAEFGSLAYDVVIEEEPLGTGGGIQLALSKTTSHDVVVVNGDTLFKVDLEKLLEVHLESGAECTLALKPLKNFDRFGAVTIDDQSKVLRFEEKKPVTEGIINGGVYILNRQQFLDRQLPETFSMEKDYLEKFVGEGKFFGSPQDSYFIDIGIPDEYDQAQLDLTPETLDLEKIDESWTLFLDRDGVINIDKGQYIRHVDHYIFAEGALEAIRLLSQRFGRIIVVTNQRGVEKELMTLEDLAEIHTYMVTEIEKAGGRIDAVYYCTSLHNDHPDRKPNPGMPLKAKAKFPEIDFQRSVMVGDKLLDMQLGRTIGGRTVLIPTHESGEIHLNPDIDMVFASLADFALSFKQ